MIALIRRQAAGSQRIEFFIREITLHEQPLCSMELRAVDQDAARLALAQQNSVGEHLADNTGGGEQTGEGMRRWRIRRSG